MTTPEPPTFRILCEEVYARAVPAELLADPDYEWRIFPDLGGDYPILYVYCDGQYLPLPATSEEGREILGGINLEALHKEAQRLHAIRAKIADALAHPTSQVFNSGLYRFFQAIAIHVSKNTLSPFDAAAIGDRILASHFDPDEIAINLSDFTEDIAVILSHIDDRDANGEEYWPIVAQMLEIGGF